MKKPRIFYLVSPVPDGTAVFSKLTYAKEYAKRYVFSFGSEVIKVKEITNEPRRPQKKAAARKASSTRKVQATAGKRKAKD